MSTKLPEILEPFHKEAEKLLSKGAVHEIEFSGGTYQIEVTDPKSKQENWAFLQLDARGQLKDYFCSCEEEESNPCAHVAAAYLRIFNQQTSPLHERFESSLWNQLCRLYAERMGFKTDILRHSGRGQYVMSSV